MFLTNGYRSRNFASPVTPCNFSVEGNGRIAAAEWIRTAFHDMATGNVFTGAGGLDGSVAFELSGATEDIGAGFATTLSTLANSLTSRSSISDLIALGVYSAVRSCSGPIVPIRTGRKDATNTGPQGVPLPQNSLGTFTNQFARVGFNVSEMIAVTACGHTLGGVHAADFPQIVTAGSAPNDFVHFDETTAFDGKVAADFVAGNTTNPLVIGPCVDSGRCSDARVFAADNNVTIAAMADPAVFQSRCRTLLQKMIDVVPKEVVLTDPIVPYEVKPVDLQLSLEEEEESLSFVGEIRVRTTNRPDEDIEQVKLIYKDRNGGGNCSNCTIVAEWKNMTSGFDDSFTVSANSSYSAPLLLLYHANQI
jgi:hypothetical protein